MDRLSDELKHCLDNSGCEECKHFEAKSVLTCRNLLQEAYERIKEYEDLEEQGKLLKLPCAVGDTVYRIDESDCESCETERPDINEKCTCKFGEFCGYEEITESKFELSMLQDFGKTVFLTKEEAESALTELQR